MSNTIDLDDLLSSKETATLLGIKPNTLEIWRHQGKGPAYLKLGDNPQSTVRYLRSAVMAWAAQRAYQSTSAHSAAVRDKRTSGFTVTPTAIPGPWEGTCRTSSRSGATS